MATANSVLFSKLLDTDLANRSMDQADLVRVLAQDGGRPVTSAAISNWRSRSIPHKQLLRVARALGNGSLIARACATGDFKFDKHEDVGSAEDVKFSQRVYEAGQGQNSYVRSGLVQGRASPLDKENAVRDALPESLRGNWGRHLVFGAIVVRPDYLSDRVAVEVKAVYTPQIPATAYKALFNLSLIQQVVGDGPRRFGLIVIADSERGYVEGLYPEQQKASLLGIEVVVVPSPEDAARVIVQWEKGTTADLFG